MRRIYITILLLITLTASCAHNRPRIKAISSSDIRKAGDEYTLVKSVHFRTDGSVVRPDDIKYLDNNIEWLKSNIDEIIILEGHCDERGPRVYNMDLGDRRARWIKSYLVQKGVNPKKIVIISYGESKPLDPGHNYSAWRKNRRVVFKLGR